MYRDIETHKEAVAERLTEKRRLGSISIPAGYWVVTCDGLTSYPSNDKFLLKYELIEFNEPTESHVSTDQLG